MLLRRIARPMLAAAFIGQGIDALRSPKPAAEAAQPTVEGLQKLPESVSSSLPDNAETIAKITAGVQIGGGLLLASGRVPRLASAALAATVIPANLGAHMFWNEVDPQRKAAKRREFLTDVSLIGGLAIAAADTAGKPSLGWRGRQAAHKLTDSVTAALPLGTTDSDLADRIGERLHEGAERGREFAVLAAGRGAPLLEAARERGIELADRSAPLLEAARERGAELADRSAPLLEAARERGTELAAELAKTAREQSEEVASEARERVRAWRRH
ncbi:MAG TPA: DoxX family protein [Mycobacterium sp.]|nr:DoxX family protein [Mycobacterium sp.]